MKKLFVRNITDNSIHEVWKYMSVTESVWCDTWPGHHIIGYDCEWYDETVQIDVNKLNQINNIIRTCYTVLNAITNQKLNMIEGKDTYAIASVIGKFLDNE